MKIQIPKLSLVLLIGASGSGKSTFAKRHFLPTEVVSSDFCRGLVCDDENDQSVSKEAFSLLHEILRRRLALGRFTVVDATNVQHESRTALIEIAREYHCLPVAIVFDLPETLCQERNKTRADRDFGPHVIRQQCAQLRRSKRNLTREGLRHVFTFNSPEELHSLVIERVPLWNDRRGDHGPFDIIGDVHGCIHELETLLTTLGYAPQEMDSPEPIWESRYFTHPEGRKAVFLGDIVDRGPGILAAIRLVRNMIKTGNALCVPGNHDMKLLRRLRGKKVQVTHGLECSLAELDSEPPEVRPPFQADLAAFLDSLVSHYVLDDGKLVVAHAGMKANMQGRGSGKVRDFALYGETTGETDVFGLPVRCDWAAEYRGEARVVYGHTPIPEPEWVNRTVNVDTGCVFGGKLTALRYPEMEFVSVPAERIYQEPAKPFLPEGEASPLSMQQASDELLDICDVLGKRIITTRLRGSIMVREENATAALEVMSRFAINPKWLTYLPPTMSPCETAPAGEYLEHPSQAFAYFRSAGVPKVVCEVKHMGSRAVVAICRDEDTARTRFGIIDEGAGVVYTRTGRRFFAENAQETELLSRLRAAMDASGLWEAYKTNWAILDCELMPWSAKAHDLLRSQYAAVGTAGRLGFDGAISALQAAAVRPDVTAHFETPPHTTAQPADVRQLLARYEARADTIERYVDAYRRYCWPVHSIQDMKLAPFHLLATEGAVHSGMNHVQHMETLAKICQEDTEMLLATPFQTIDVTEPKSETIGIQWWEELTSNGGEGMVVKPFDFIQRGKKGLIQPAIKVRGREYLRIIYGPEYTNAAHMERLRARRLGIKRTLALNEFALGIEALERFVRHEPLRRVHECVFGVLALESEPVDPRL